MTNVEMLTQVGTPRRQYLQGTVYRVTDATAASWINAKLAKPSDRCADDVADFLARLDQGAGQPCLFLPFVGEFGHLVMTHMRMVHFHRASRKVVCCRRGEEVLYPSADECVTDWCDPIRDAWRVATMRSWQIEWPNLPPRFPGHVVVSGAGLTPEQELFALYPEQPIPFTPQKRGLYADVILGVRRRQFCPERNWQHWQSFADALTESGYSFAVIGHRSTSFALKGQVCHSGDLDTDAAVELLQGCRLYVGGDSGNSHLAATVGAPMLLFREVAGGSRDMVGRMQEVNAQPIRVLQNAWDRPQDVIDAALKTLAEAKANNEMGIHHAASN